MKFQRAGVAALGLAATMGACGPASDRGAASLDGGPDAASTVMDAGAPGNNRPDAEPDSGETPPVPDGGSTTPSADAQATEDASACVRPPNVDAGACWAACCTPAGTVQPLSSAEAIYRAIEGRWLFCSPATWVESFAVPTDAVGIEFGPGVVADGGCGVTGGTNCGGGDVYLLVNGPSGPVRGLGFAYQWTYDIGGYLQFNLHPGYAAIAGRWQFCSQQNLKNTFGAPPDSVGIEFVLTDPGDASCSEAASGACGRGNVYYLVQGPSGPVRGAGFDYQLTFNAFPIAGGVGGPTYQLDLTTTGSYLTNIRYSPCPTEIAMTGYGVDTPVILVPLY